MELSIHLHVTRAKNTWTSEIQVQKTSKGAAYFSAFPQSLTFVLMMGFSVISSSDVL